MVDDDAGFFEHDSADELEHARSEVDRLVHHGVLDVHKLALT